MAEAYHDEDARRQLSRYKGPLARYFRDQEQNLAFAQVDLRDRTVLDLGCGVGRLSKSLVEQNVRRVLACDLSLMMVRAAAIHNRHPKVDYFVCDGARLPLPTASTQAVFALGTFEAIADITRFLTEVHRVLESNGFFAFTVWNGSRWKSPDIFDGRRRGSLDYQPDELRKMLAANGFIDVRMSTTFFLPRRIFWAGYRISRAVFLDAVYVEACNRSARILREWSATRDLGWVLLVTCRSGDPATTLT